MTDKSENIQSRYYRHLCDSAGLAIIGTDCQGMVINCNPAAEAMFEREASHLLGRHVVGVIAEKDRREFNRLIEEVVTSGKMRGIETEHVGKDATLVLDVVITPVHDDEGQLLGLAIWVHDITRSKNLERQLIQAERLASVGTLASGVAHHFNNIIGGVATFVDFALTSGNPQSTQRALQMTAEAANRIGKITQSLLTFAERDMRQFDLSDINEVMLTFCSLIEGPLQDKGIMLESHLCVVPVVEVPGSRMHQMFGHLLDNAECAMPNGGVLTIELFRDVDEIVISFGDSGLGIESKDLPHVFEPFFTTRGVSGGGNQPCAGLGLSVVHGIVSELGGMIAVQSKVKQGTVFTVRLPIKKTSEIRYQESD